MTSADTTGKVTAARLRRDAYLYIRQSTLYQVANNTESTCACRKPMPPGDIHESCLQRDRAAGCGSDPGR